MTLGHRRRLDRPPARRAAGPPAGAAHRHRVRARGDRAWRSPASSASTSVDGPRRIEANRPWLPKGVTIDLTPGNVALVGLVISAVVVQWAVYSIANDDRPRAYLALGLTVLLGGAYINGMAFNYTQMGITVHDPRRACSSSRSPGMHLAMAGAGMIFVGLMAFRALGGQYSGRDREGIVAAAMYWHVTVLVFAVIWFTIFVTK